MTLDEFENLLDCYFSIAYVQGRENRNHDDKEGTAQEIERELVTFVRQLMEDCDYWKIEAEGEGERAKVAFRDRKAGYVYTSPDAKFRDPNDWEDEDA